MNILHLPLFLILLALTACTNVPVVKEEPLPRPPQVIEVKVPIAVPCITELPQRPEECVPKDSSRPEYLRCVLVNATLNSAYQHELENILVGCKRGVE